MIENKKILALIPARSGSKGIKDKNIKKLNGKPLLAYTIEAAKKSNVCDDIIVSTDSEKIAEIAKLYGASVPFLRSKKNSDDESKTIDAVVEVVEQLKRLDKFYDVLILLQPTSPLRSSNDIVNCLNVFLEYNMKGIVSICEATEHPILFRELKEGRLSKYNNTNSTVRRQEFEKLYRVNGAIYINLLSDINKDLSFNDNENGYIMSIDSSIDIDTELDFEFAEFLIKKRLFEV